MKLLVTGGAGFIGSAVVRRAIKEGHQVVNLDALTYAGRLENVSEVSDHPNHIFFEADVCDRDALDWVLSEHRPDVVMHLAAESHVDRSIDGPYQFVETNVNGTFTALEASRFYWEKQGRPEKFKFHHISTDEVFGSLGSTGKFTEESRYDPRSPYSASKAASDHLVRAWHETYGLPVILTNCSNNYGPYQFPEKLIPVTITRALDGKSLPIYGDGSNVRDWLFVEDHAEALLLVIEKAQIGRSYNIGGENEYSNLQLVKMLCAVLDRCAPRTKPYSDLITFVTDRPGHDARYSIDPTRIKQELGWKPSVSMAKGLERTVKWFLDNESWWRVQRGFDGNGAKDTANK